MRMAAMAAAVVLMGQAARADCVDINADDPVRLGEIVHIDAARAAAIAAGRPWPSVESLTAIHGIGRGRIRDIVDEGLACVGQRAAAGERQRLEGPATVVDADTFVVAGIRVRLIGIDAPEASQSCQAEERDWPCGEAATAAVEDLVGTRSVACDVYGHDRWNRALAVCFQDGVDLNAEIVRQGWAVAWYPDTGAVIGPNYADAQEEAELKAAGIWQGGEFLDPWAWRQLSN